MDMMIFLPFSFFAPYTFSRVENIFEIGLALRKEVATLTALRSSGDGRRGKQQRKR
jgi:hypothetical protein